MVSERVVAGPAAKPDKTLADLQVGVIIKSNLSQTLKKQCQELMLLSVSTR